MTINMLKNLVLDANLLLPQMSLVQFTWGNVSMRHQEWVAIKPSGVEYSQMSVDDIVVLDLEGNVIEGNKNPSSDTPTHLRLYKEYPELLAVCHTHSPWATIFCQAGLPIPPLGTTHADHFYGQIPITRPMTEEEIAGDYELNTAHVIIECLKDIDPLAIPAVLVNQHGPFTFGSNAKESAETAAVLEITAKMAYSAMQLNPNLIPISQKLLDKHYLRKHGGNAYYGQKG